MRSLTLTLDVPDWAEAYLSDSYGLQWLKVDEEEDVYINAIGQDEAEVGDPRVVLLKKEE